MTQGNSKKPARWLTLSRQIVIGLTAGIACGLFFGEICGIFQGAGKAFVALMQMTVLPYIVLALIVNIGSLTLDTARHLAVRAAVVLLALWVDLMKSEGVIAVLHDHWILGRSAVPQSTRWSIIRNVLHWAD